MPKLEPKGWDRQGRVKGGREEHQGERHVHVEPGQARTLSLTHSPAVLHLHLFSPGLNYKVTMSVCFLTQAKLGGLIAGTLIEFMTVVHLQVQTLLCVPTAFFFFFTASFSFLSLLFTQHAVLPSIWTFTDPGSQTQTPPWARKVINPCNRSGKG